MGLHTQTSYGMTHQIYLLSWVPEQPRAEQDPVTEPHESDAFYCYDDGFAPQIALPRHQEL